MKCQVCGFDGEFKLVPYISDISYGTESVGGYDDYGNGHGTEAITNIVIDHSYFYVCPTCGIVKFNEID